MARNQTLTAKQEKFCYNIAVMKMTQHAAYVDAYDTHSLVPATIDVNASMVRSNTKIARRINELLDRQYEPEILTVTGRKKVLSEIAQDTKNPAYRVPAVRELNNMEQIGKVEVNIKADNLNVLLQEIRTLQALPEAKDKEEEIEGYISTTGAEDTDN